MHLSEPQQKPFLQIAHLAVHFNTRHGVVEAVKDVNITLQKGEILAIVGESGSGKSVTAYSMLHLLGKTGSIAHGTIEFDGMTLHNANKALMAEIRGREIAMIFQNPMSTLNPIRKVGDQLADMLRQHAQATRANAQNKIAALLTMVEIKDIERIQNAYPFELSGGQCQRVMIALALACGSRLLIADEPTTGLDVTTQKTIMDLIANLAKQKDLAVILITHDLGLAARYCDRFVVMEKGLVVEQADRATLLQSPTQAYTKKLIAATPRMNSRLADLTTSTISPLSATTPSTTTPPPLGPVLLRVDNLIKRYRVKSSKGKKGHGDFNAVDDVSFDIYQGECVGLVGESGCGKSTTAKIVCRLEDPTSGNIAFCNTAIGDIAAKDFIRNPYRKDIQMVFQDPSGSLNPRHTVSKLIAEPFYRLGSTAQQRNLENTIAQLCERVGLNPDLMQRLPHQLSGGQKARVGIARAIALNPKLLILDEPTSALDVSVQAIVLQLLEKLRVELQLSYLFVSHDLNVVKMLSQRVLVMQKGKIVEAGNTEEILNRPKNPFTQALIDSIPHLHCETNP